EPPQDVGEHSGPPDGAVRSRFRVVWPRTQCGNAPFLDGDVHGTWNHDRLRSWLRRKILGEIIRYFAFLLGSEVDHGPEKLLPFLSRIAAGIRDQAERVALRALGLNRLPAGSFRQCHLPSALSATLAAGRIDREHQNGAEKRSQ